MGAKRGAKRSVEAPTEQDPAPKKVCEPATNTVGEGLKRYGISRSNYNTILDALAHPIVDELGLPEDCRKMLDSMVLHSICVPADERHPHQDAAVEILGELFSDIRKKLEDSVAAKEDELQALLGGSGSREARAREAEALLESAAGETKLCKSALTDATNSLLAARTKVSEKQAEKQRSDAASRQAIADKDALDAMLESDFQALRDGTYEDGTAKGHFEIVTALVGRLKLDESLVSALPSSLMKMPEGRGEFDKMVVKQLENALDAKARDLVEIVEAASPRAEECAQAVSQAQHHLEAVVEVQRAAATDLNTAQEKLSRVTSDLEVAKMAVANFLPQLKKVETLRDESRRALGAFEEQHLGCYNLLKDRVSARRQKELAAITPAPSLQEAASAGA